MMKLAITINMNNEAFFDSNTNTHNWKKEASRILRHLADRIDHPIYETGYPISLRDKNGNLVGDAVLSNNS